MKLKKITAACSLALAALFGAATPAQAQISGDVIRIGIITDMSSVYADIDGAGGVEAIKMAIADAGGSVAGDGFVYHASTVAEKPRSVAPSALVK